MDSYSHQFRSCKTSNPHRLLFNFANKNDLQRGEKRLALSNLSVNYTGININPYRNIKFK